MLYTYPVLIQRDKFDFVVFVPDFNIYTEGTSYEDAVYMSKDVLTLFVTDMIDDKKELPTPSTKDEAVIKTKFLADEKDFKYSTGSVEMISFEI